MPTIKHLAITFLGTALAVAIIARVPFLRTNVLKVT
jgi:hypothetical protein